MESVARLFTPPQGSFFLFGPRGTGKSTFVRERFAQALTLDLLDPERIRSLSAHPEHLRELVEARPSTEAVVIDEVQRVPELLPVVHSLIESRKGRTFVLTGSSARKLKRTGVNLLGGRAARREMHPFMAAELGSRFDFGTALVRGLLPLVHGAPDPDEVLRSYVSLYLREEVQMEGLVRNVGHFSRFLESISLSHASVLNLSNVARDCEVGRKTVEGFVEILEDLLLAWRIPVFTRRARRELAAHPKFFLFDVGVYRSLRPKGPLDRPEEIEGHAIEGLVAQHLRAWQAYAKVSRGLFYWRTRSNVEVDFVVYGPDGLWAIEVKNSGKVVPEDLRGLRAFQEEYPSSHTILLYRGKDRLMKDKILCLPCESFLRRLHPDHTLDEAAEP
jgi:predicted AAA+ superfamily ATPase